MSNERTHSIDIGEFEFVFGVEDIDGIAVINFGVEKGKYVFLKRFKKSIWSRFAEWVDSKLLKNKTTFISEQWVDISWFKDRKHTVQSYNFISVGKNNGKSEMAPYAASLGMMHCFAKKENSFEGMPDYVQVHFKSIFGNKSFIYSKIMDHDYKGEIISSFMVCKSMSQKHVCCEGSKSIH